MLERHLKALDVTKKENIRTIRKLRFLRVIYKLRVGITSVFNISKDVCRSVTLYLFGSARSPTNVGLSPPMMG